MADGGVYIPWWEVGKGGDEKGEVAFRRASKLAIFPSRRDASSTRRRRRRSNLFGNSKSLGRNDGLGIKCMRQQSVFAPRPRNLSAGSPAREKRRTDRRGKSDSTSKGVYRSFNWLRFALIERRPRLKITVIVPENHCIAPEPRAKLKDMFLLLDTRLFRDKITLSNPAFYLSLVKNWA